MAERGFEGKGEAGDGVGEGGEGAVAASYQGNVGHSGRVRAGTEAVAKAVACQSTIVVRAEEENSLTNLTPRPCYDHADP